MAGKKTLKKKVDAEQIVEYLNNLPPDIDNKSSRIIAAGCLSYLLDHPKQITLKEVKELKKAVKES